MDFRIYNLNNTMMIPRNNDQGKWMKPLVGFLKIIVDATWVSNMVGVSFIVRDSNGFMIGGEIKYIEDVACIAWAETVALLHGITWASKRDLSNIILEGDIVNVINRVSKQRDDISFTGFRIQTCRSKLEIMDKCSVTWCQRHCNKLPTY